MSQLPNGWADTRLGQLCDFEMGQAPPGADCNKIGIGTPFVKAGEFGAERPIIREWTVNPLKHARATDVLICVVGATAGKINLGTDCSIGRSVAAMRPATALDQYFLYRFMATQVESLRSESSGSAQGVISKEKLANVEIALPPLSEQKRIVAKIDSLSGKSKRARDHLDHIPRLVEKYKQAVLAAAFRGDLTREWRAQNPMPAGSELAAELLYAHQQLFGKKAKIVVDTSTAADLCQLPKSWTWMPVAALSTKVVDGVHKKPTYQEQGIPFLTVRNLTAGPGISFEGCRFISNDDHLDFIRRTNPEHGDILITKDGTLGVVRAVRTRQDFSIFVSLALVKPIDRSMTNYLELAFLSPILQQQMGGVGSGLQHIHLTDLRKDLVPVAPPEERDEIVKRARKALDWIDHLASEAKSATQLVQNLDQAVLAKAFRGELAPQDPCDEPATKLLERIAAERAAIPKAKRRSTRMA